MATASRTDITQNMQDIVVRRLVVPPQVHEDQRRSSGTVKATNMARRSVEATAQAARMTFVELLPS